MEDQPKIVIAPEYGLRVKQHLALVRYAGEDGVLPASQRVSLDRRRSANGVISGGSTVCWG